MGTTTMPKRASTTSLVVGLAVLVSVVIVSVVALGRGDSNVDRAVLGGAGSSAAADAGTRTPVPAECPATFDLVPAPTEPAPRAVFVPSGATGATLCRYFGFNEARGTPLIPLSETRDLPGAPDALIRFLNSLPQIPKVTESVGPDGVVLLGAPCDLVLVPMFFVVLHYAGSLNILVRTDPSCQSVTSDGDGRQLQQVSDLLQHWGLEA